MHEDDVSSQSCHYQKVSEDASDIVTVKTKSLQTKCRPFSAYVSVITSSCSTFHYYTSACTGRLSRWAS
ncbi:hypothetical protein CEXT_646071 [Caerostris extrusa]|uniref:Uncharacterized protein n=1 Tax=Caerostris extrusa TaxID=172846 RepID=A0AAV4UJJ0_CAEEX|nr:hypothetical protein CEXT_646071 [Caerostris extrusa]